MTRALLIGWLLALAACEGASPDSLLPTAAANDTACVSEKVKVSVETNRILWNGEAVDEPELARRSAAHWCGARPYVIIVDQPLPDPNDHAGIALSIRVGKLIGTKQATLADTLRKLADGSY